MTLPKSPQNKKERGQSMVELSLGLLALIVIVTGIIDLGRVLFQYTALRDASQEAAVYAAMYPPKSGSEAADCDAINDRARTALANSGEASVTVDVYFYNSDESTRTLCVSAATSQTCAGRRIAVEVKQANFPLTMPVIGQFLGRNGISLQAQVDGTVLRPKCP
jgi:Flp pilus assembly protein TadG